MLRGFLNHFFVNNEFFVDSIAYKATNHLRPRWQIVLNFSQHVDIVEEFLIGAHLEKSVDGLAHCLAFRYNRHYD